MLRSIWCLDPFEIRWENCAGGMIVKNEKGEDMDIFCYSSSHLSYVHKGWLYMQCSVSVYI